MKRGHLASLEGVHPPWMAWVLGNVQAGLLVLDEDVRVVLANDWLLQRARLSGEQLMGQPLSQAFPGLVGSHFERALHNALRTGLASVLSETLHRSPLPLYTPHAKLDNARLLKQSIQIIPMSSTVAREVGQRYVLVQISDVTPAVDREHLLRATAQKLHGMAHVDALTRIGNRRHFDEMLAREWRHAQRQRQSLALVMLDVDHFKFYNDLYGHQRGDECLRTVAEVINSVAKRPRDVACRYGGEELVMLLPDTDLASAVTLAQKVVDRLRGMQLPHPASPSRCVTLSAGVVADVPEMGVDPDALLQMADRALYKAKSHGRDQVATYGAA
jgi:diguanylate cyclase (GGDEF)-like protein